MCKGGAKAARWEMVSAMYRIPQVFKKPTMVSPSRELLSQDLINSLLRSRKEAIVIND